jgi:phosphatidylserine/phosphatidylglycerophosphate/cardiolipin synthase-like enzyme
VKADASSRARVQVEPTPRPAERVDWLIDNADALRALVLAIREATSTIWMSQLALDADFVAHDIPGHGADGVRLVDELLAATHRGVSVRVLLNASLLLDTARTLRAHLAAVGADRERFRVRGISRFPQLLHAKLVIVDDDVAFLLGSPFANGYWDTSRHAPTDARRPMRELGGRAVHDVSTRFTGMLVDSLGATFADLWNSAGDVEPDDADQLRAALPAVRLDVATSMRVVRTAPGDGPTEIVGALLDGVDDARELIYIEHQYLSARVVVDALVRALERRHDLEIIIVLNQNPDVTAYRSWQNERMAAARLLQHPRVGVFTLWTSAVAAARVRQVSQVFVHSKVVTVDDEWALVGSANLDGVSLHSYGADFSSALGRRVFRDVRNFDVNVVIEAERGTAVVNRVRAFRAALWAEHLGPSLRGVGARPAGGWLGLWRSVASRNVAALQRPVSDGDVDGSFVLPYSSRSTPRAQLATMGVLLAPHTTELCFEPSWLEVHCSPTWIRNMFA